MEIAWIIAESITDRYHAAGYFLSRAYVPPQSIKDGKITVKVIEGYVGNVKVSGAIGDNRVIQEYVARLMMMKPVTIDAVESFLLRLNDLPGYSFRAVLSPLENREQDDPAVELVMEPVSKDAKGSISFDDFSSHYLGPDEFSASYSTSVLPLQQTTVSGLNCRAYRR